MSPKVIARLADADAFGSLKLSRRGILRNEALRKSASGKWVCVSGLVTVRQRPGSANGVIFLSIEDETALANIIVWPKTFERFRPVVLGARYVAVTGRMQEESGVIHVVSSTRTRTRATSPRAPSLVRGSRSTAKQHQSWPAISTCPPAPPATSSPNGARRSPP